MTMESPQRIEPARLEELPEAITNIVADLAAASAALGQKLHPVTASSLASLVQIMNTYYSNLIEGHNTRPREIVQAMEGRFDENEERRNLQIEAVSHARVQSRIDRLALESNLPEPASMDFIRWLHREFYREVPVEMLRIRGRNIEFIMRPGKWRSSANEDVVVGRHVPPSSDRIPDFMRYFESRYRFSNLGMASKIVSMAAAHHRFNYIHPFPDGNGRVSRLMSHTMAHAAGIGAHGLWSISRGLARGIESRMEYKSMMDLADTPRQGDLDGRGNLSTRALTEFILWFLRVCLDQVKFMSSLFELETLSSRLRKFVERHDKFKPEAARLLEEALMRGEFPRGDISRITGLPERSARRILNDLEIAGLLASVTPKAAVSLRFPPDVSEVLFPNLFPET